MAAREAIPKSLQLQVWYRDEWHCQYCAEPIFFSPTLALLDRLSPGHGYYDQHGKRGKMLSLFENLCACCDHVEPVSSGSGQGAAHGGVVRRRVVLLLHSPVLGQPSKILFGLLK